MAENRDLLDEFIDIKNDWQALSNPVSDVAERPLREPRGGQDLEPGGLQGASARERQLVRLVQVWQ